MQDQDDLYLYRSNHKEIKSVPAPTFVVRRFLVKELPEDIKNFLIHRFVIVYIGGGKKEIKFSKRQIIDVNSPEFFVEENYLTTEKFGFGKARTTTQESLSKEDFEMMLNGPVGKTICKDRCFSRADNGSTITIDIYTGKLQGLTIAKVKFETISDAERFVKPEWLGAEVTNSKEYLESNLATTQCLPASLQALERM